MLVQPARALDRKDVQNCTQTVDLDRAIAGCTRALEARLPDNIRSAVYVSRGAVFEKKGDSDRAIADFSEAIRINPRSADAFFIRANAYSRAGDFDRASADYNETIRIDPNHAKSYDGRGFAYYRKGEYDRTIADENEALRLDPKYANAYNNRGIAYGQKGDDDRAFADYDRAILMDPKQPYAYANRARIYGQKGDHDRALADGNEAIQINPKNVNAWIVRGNAYSAKSEFERAIASYDDAIRLNPLDREALTGRGLAYEKQADIARARSDFKAALGSPARGRNERAAQDKARERLAALADAPVVAGTPLTTTRIADVSPPVAVNDHRIALVIGNSVYEKVPALPNPERDAAFVAETLKRSGFESVIVQTNLRKDALVGALRNFAAQAEKADWALIYYAGHGMEVGGVNYLIPLHATITADRDIGFEAVALEQVLTAAERAKKLRLVNLDARPHNPFPTQIKPPL